MSSRSCVQIDDSVISAGFFNSFDCVLTDCDGVLWLGTTPIPGSIETIQALIKMGKRVIYVTNNCSKSRDDYKKKLTAFGFSASLDDIIPTSYCVAAYLLSKNFQKKVYVLGSVGIADELDKAKIQRLPIGPDHVGDNLFEWLSELKLDPDVGAVVLGHDHYVSYPKMIKAASYLKIPDTLFILTCRDDMYPIGSGKILLPGPGAFASSIEFATGRTATVVGKPERRILDCIKLGHPEIDFSRCIMIGDRLDTDILLGTKHGLKTLLVATGVHCLEDVRHFEKSTDKEDGLFIPDYYLPSLGDLQKFI